MFFKTGLNVITVYHIQLATISLCTSIFFFTMISSVCKIYKIVCLTFEEFFKLIGWRSANHQVTQILCCVCLSDVSFEVKQDEKWPSRWGRTWKCSEKQEENYKNCHKCHPAYSKVNVEGKDDCFSTKVYIDQLFFEWCCAPTYW